MRNLIITFYLLISAITYSQNAENNFPSIVEQKTAYFHKDNLKPFTGNLIFKDDETNLIIKSKIINGFETLSEVYNQKNELVRLLENGIDAEIQKTTTHKSKFLPKDKFTDTLNIEHKTVIISYINNNKTKEKIKFNGIVSFNNTKLYYKNGIIFKIVNFYDEDFKRIKESYEIFYTELGNIEFAGEEKIFNGNYKKWNEEGKVIESGVYKQGKKVK
ncbi:hypothetical protein [Flavobacterium sp.]|uniref:hypothetical protein n=1 Tax=Flavobacterium sp. TaxID=239 RepID=UPI0026317109|nr:hypothetical protein [Flavobacterium sp.]